MKKKTKKAKIGTENTLRAFDTYSFELSPFFIDWNEVRRNESIVKQLYAFTLGALFVLAVWVLSGLW